MNKNAANTVKTAKSSPIWAKVIAAAASAKAEALQAQAGQQAKGA
jgi:hypothetical protein